MGPCGTFFSRINLLYSDLSIFVLLHWLLETCLGEMNLHSELSNWFLKQPVFLSSCCLFFFLELHQTEPMAVPRCLAIGCALVVHSDRVKMCFYARQTESQRGGTKIV